MEIKSRTVRICTPILIILFFFFPSSHKRVHFTTDIPHGVFKRTWFQISRVISSRNIEWHSLTQTAIQDPCARFWGSVRGIRKCNTRNFYNDVACTINAFFVSRSQRANSWLERNIRNILFHNVTLITMFQSKRI